MEAVDEEPLNIVKNFNNGPINRKQCIPKQLKEANELLKSINRRLEDCGLEWKSDISKKQWKFLNAKQAGQNLLEQSVLARTYFIDKDLDQSFQHLLSCNKIFSECLNNFIGLLSGSQVTKETSDTQWTHSIESYAARKNSVPEPVSPVGHRQTNSQSKADLLKNLLEAQESFSSVIKAKEEFDDKLLGFKNVLHKAASTTTTEDCRCPYCSYLLANRSSRTIQSNIVENNTVAGRIRRRRRRRISRISSKRTKKPPMSVGDVNQKETLTPRN